MCWRLPWLTVLALAVACKPADEPPRSPAQPTAHESPAGAAYEAESAAARLGTIRLVAVDEPDAEVPSTDATVAEGAAAADVSPEVSEAVADGDPLALPPDVVAQLRRAASDDQVSTARAANRDGLRLHRKLELPAAIRAYERGLEAWPGHPFTHYNLACALALTGERAAALRHLRMLAALPGEDAAERLRRARVDPDLEALHDDPVFRAVTGFVPVHVAWSPDLGDGPARELVGALQDARVPATLGAPWREEVSRSRLLVVADDPAAEAMANEVAAQLPASAQRGRLDAPVAGAPVVLVLAPAEAGLAEQVGSADGPEAFIGTALTARSADSVSTLWLKATGFFKWEIAADSGRRTTQTGRYVLQNGALRVDFRQVTETPDAVGGEPEIAIDQGRRATHEVRVSGDALLVDGVAYRKAR